MVCSAQWGRVLGALCCLLLGPLLGACDSQAVDGHAIAAPHLEAFGETERWCRRTFAASLALRGQGQLEATLFAPLQLESQVLGAWVRKDDAAPRAFRREPEEFFELNFIAFQHQGRRYDVAVTDAMVVVAREQGGLVVAVGYRREAAAP